LSGAGELDRLFFRENGIDAMRIEIKPEYE
jgi:hypothetical protein